MAKVVSIVGMAGAGKSEVAGVFEERGFVRVRFGDLTDQEMAKSGLGPGEKNERHIRELLRRDYGMAAYAILNRPRIDSALKDASVVVDGLYSWEEYTWLRSCYGKDLCVVAVWASPKTRHTRLAGRARRPLTAEAAVSRDMAEIENANKGGPIAMADVTIINEASREGLRQAVTKVINRIVSDGA